MVKTILKYTDGREKEIDCIFAAPTSNGARFSMCYKGGNTFADTVVEMSGIAAFNCYDILAEKGTVCEGPWRLDALYHSDDGYGVIFVKEG